MISSLLSIVCFKECSMNVLVYCWEYGLAKDRRMVEVLSFSESFLFRSLFLLEA